MTKLHIRRRSMFAVAGVGALAVAGVAVSPALAATASKMCSTTNGSTYTCQAPSQSLTKFVVPAGVHVLTVDAVGAWGGHSKAGGTTGGGKPDEVQAELMVGPGEVVYFAVGGAGGTKGAGGYNGGGAGGNGLKFAGAGGGGSSDVRFGSSSLGARVLVAAGGGGAGPVGAGGAYDSAGQPGNTKYAGTPGQSGDVSSNGGATPAGDGSFGQGGNGTSVESSATGGGGGGGGYGGGGAGDSAAGGGGGSTFLNYGTFGVPGSPAPTTAATTAPGSNGSISFSYTTSSNDAG